MKIGAEDVLVPLDVPRDFRQTYVENFLKMTRNSGRLMLFAGDQKVEHLNDDFYGEGIHPDDSRPDHLFEIASRANIGVFATQLGLIARYGADYPNVPYLRRTLLAPSGSTSRMWWNSKAYQDSTS